MTVLASTRNRLFAAWLALVAITVIYLWIDRAADEDGIYVASVGVTVAAIALALVKFRIVLREFMDVRHAPVALRRWCDLLVAVIGVSMLTTYLVGRAVA